MAAWRDRDHLQQLAADAFNTSPTPPAYQLALLGCLPGVTGPRGTAIRLLGEACRRQPGNFWLNREMGTTLFKAGRTGESIAYYRAALALRPNNGGAHDGFGMAPVFFVGQSDEAFACFRRAVELSSCSRSSCPASGGLLGRRPAVGPRPRTSAASPSPSDPTDPLPAHPPRHLSSRRPTGRGSGGKLARAAIQADPNSSPAYYYLGLTPGATGPAR